VEIDEEKFRIVGVYEVPNKSGVNLIEILVRRNGINLDFEEVTQEDSNKSRSNWQVPYDEQLIEESLEHSRYVFFFHYLDFKKPLLTKHGSVVLPAVTSIPERLAHIVYEPPC